MHGNRVCQKSDQCQIFVKFNIITEVLLGWQVSAVEQVQS